MMYNYVVVIDDHPIIFNGIETLLASMNGYQLSGKYLSSRDFLANVGGMRIDLLIVDITPGRPESTVDEKIVHLHQQFPHVPILAFSEYHVAADCNMVMQAGARGYISKTAELRELRFAINEICSGRIYKPLSCKSVGTNYDSLHV